MYHFFFFSSYFSSILFSFFFTSLFNFIHRWGFSFRNSNMNLFDECRTLLLLSSFFDYSCCVSHLDCFWMQSFFVVVGFFFLTLSSPFIYIYFYSSSLFASFSAYSQSLHLFTIVIIDKHCKPLKLVHLLGLFFYSSFIPFSFICGFGKFTWQYYRNCNDSTTMKRIQYLRILTPKDILNGNSML